MTTTQLTPEQRKQILKRYRWSMNSLARELKMRGKQYSHMAIYNWIINKNKLRDTSTVLALSSILSFELNKEGIEIEQLFNIDLK